MQAEFTIALTSGNMPAFAGLERRSDPSEIERICVVTENKGCQSQEFRRWRCLNSGMAQVHQYDEGLEASGLKLRGASAGSVRTSCFDHLGKSAPHPLGAEFGLAQ
jgi:hypothetical protein